MTCVTTREASDGLAYTTYIGSLLVENQVFKINVSR